MIANADLAELARAMAVAEPRGSAGRRAWGCVAVALATTRTTTAARKVLAGWDGPPEVTIAALAALAELIRDTIGDTT